MPLVQVLAVPSVFAAAAIEYSVQFEGIEDQPLRASLQDASDTYALQEEPPSSLVHLRRRTERDKERFLKILHSKGHFEAEAEAELDTEAQPVRVVFRIAPGPVYTVQKVHVTLAPDSSENPSTLPSPERIGLPPGTRASASNILDAEAKLLRELRQAGHPFPKVTRRNVVADPAGPGTEVTYVVDPGRKAVFGETTIEGLDTVDERVVRRTLPWTPGDSFQATLLQKAQRALYDLNLFSSVRIEISGEVLEDGSLPIRIEVAERKHRTIALGFDYYTDLGPGIHGHWEHRNMRDRGHKLTIDAGLRPDIQDLEIHYGWDTFYRGNQALDLALRTVTEDRDAYETKYVRGSATVSRKVRADFSWEAGVAVRIGSSTQKNRAEHYTFVSTPLTIRWDRSNDLLDPTEGFRLEAQIQPYTDPLDFDPNFVKTQAEYRRYWRLDPDAKWVLAARGKLGALFGGERDDVPPDLRFYAGGGGSIRGYTFKTVSPLDDDDPIGGTKLLEWSLELRKKFTENIGMAAFVDGGTAYEENLLDFQEDVQWGAGVGARYYTPLGPLRLDVAVPVNPRDGIDPPFQVYISIGQSF